MQKLAVVYFPSIDLDRINNFRQKYDPNWNIIRPHITLVLPISHISEELLFQHIETVTKKLKSFPINLSGITKSLDNYLFLQVKEGKKELIQLHDKLCSGVLASYLQSDIPFSPHITLGYFGIESHDFNERLYDKAYGEVSQLNLNINCIFDNLTIVKGDELTPAKILKTFKLN